MSKLAKSTLVVSSLSTFGLIFTFYTNILIAEIFGAGFAMDSYLAAISLPTYIITILSGALSITFIPVFADYKNSNPQQAWTVVNSIVNLVSGIMIVIAIIIALFSNPIMKLIAPGFLSSQIVLSSHLLQLFVPTIFFMVLNELFASIYYSHNMFFTPMLNKIINPVVTILYLMLLSSSLNITTLVIATLTGATLQFVILVYGILHNPVFSYKFQFSFYNDGVKKVVFLMTPLILGMLVYKILPVFDRMILSSLPLGNISYLNYASKLQLSLVQIIATGISIPVFPLLAGISAEKHWQPLKETIAEIIRIVIFISLPFAIYCAIAGESIIRILFQRGEFTSTDTIFVYRAFVLYMISLPIVAIGGVVSQGLYVLRDTKTPVLVGFVETALYIGLCFLLLPYFHYLAIPISYGIYFTFSVIVLGSIFRKKLGLGGGKELIHSIIRNAVLAFSIGSIFWALIRTIAFSDILLVVLCCICIVLYLVIAKILQFKEAQTVFEKLYDLFNKRQAETNIL